MSELKSVEVDMGHYAELVDKHKALAADEMYAALDLCVKALPIAGDSEMQDNARLAALEALAKARGE